MIYGNKLVRILALSAAFVLPLAWAATASADIVEAVPLSKNQSYQKPTKAGKEKGIWAISSYATVETSEGSLSDMNCQAHILATALFDGTKACAWANIQTVGTGTLCPLLPENALVDFSGPYTVEPDGSIFVDAMALGGLAPTKVTILPNLNVDGAVMSCQDRDLDETPGSSTPGKTWVVCTGTLMKINKSPKVRIGGNCSVTTGTTCAIDGQCPTGEKCVGGNKVPATCP